MSFDCISPREIPFDHNHLPCSISFDHISPWDLEHLAQVPCSASSPPSSPFSAGASHTFSPTFPHTFSHRPSLTFSHLLSSLLLPSLRCLSVSISLGSTAVIFLTMTFYMLASHQDVVSASNPNANA